MDILIADYGLDCWYGNRYDYEDRLEFLKSLGYNGLERLHARTEAEVINTAALAKRMNMCFATCEGGTSSESIRWSAALGMKYIWTQSHAGDRETFYRQVNAQCDASEKYGVKTALHNHMYSMVETWEQLTEYMARCPKSGLILDTAHLAVAGGDPLRAVDDYFDRLVMVHVKDFVRIDPEQNNGAWYRFCELGGGEMGDVNLQVIEKLLAKGYKGPLAVEHDTHLRDPEIDLAISREYIRRAGI